MADQKKKQKSEPESKKSGKKKSFWSHFFEPVPTDEEADPASANRQYGEPPEAPVVHLFRDDELTFSDEEDAENLENLTWDDGEKVVADAPQVKRGKRRPAEGSGDKPTEPIRLFDDEAEADESDAPKREGTTRIFRTGTSATARIHLNATEETIRAEEAQRKERAREAQRRHEAYIERQNRNKKRAAAMRKLFGNVAFVLFLLAAMLVALYYGFLLSDVVVIGNETYSQEYIVGLTDLKLGTHMLLCDLDQASEDIAEDPYLQVESVTYIFPTRIRIIVSERKEVAGIIGLDYNVIIDKNGYVLSMSGGTSLENLLQVTGISMAGFQVGERLGQGNDFSTATLIQLIDKLEQFGLTDQIRSIDLTTPLAITMVTDYGAKDGGGFTIHVGQATDLDAKMSVLARLLPQFKEKGVTEGTLFLSSKGGAVYSPKGAQASAEASAQPPVGEGDLDTTNPMSGDLDGDGFDDLTNEPYVPPTPAPTPTVAPVAGAEDEFSG